MQLALVTSRALGSALLVAAALLAPTAVKAEGGGQPIAVSQTLADAELEGVAPGFTLWLRTRFEESGFEPDPGVGATGDPAATVAAAAERGLAHAVVPQLRHRDGRVEVRLKLYAPASGTLRAVARASAPLARIGEACVQSFVQLATQMGAPPLGTPPAPLLDELATSSLALRARADGRLYDAWRAVQGKLSPIAMGLREQIVEEARRKGAPVSERARVLTANGELPSAWSLIARPVQETSRSPRPDPRLLVAGGEVQLARRNARTARRYFEQALEQAPDDASARLGLARVLILQGDTAGAQTQLLRAAEIAPDDPVPLRELARLTQAEPAIAAEHLLAAGRRAARRLDAHGARRLYARAAKLDAEAAVEGSIALGRLEEDLGRPAEALSAYRAAVDGGAARPAVLVAVARTHRTLGDDGSAEAALDQALSLDPKHPEALSDLGALYTDSGRAREAVPLLRAASERARDQVKVRRRLALALRAGGEAEQAIAILMDDKVAPSPENLQQLAELQLEQGRPDAARLALESALELDPDAEGLHAGLARVLEAQGDADGARRERGFEALLYGTSGESGTGGLAAPALSLDDLITTFASQVTQSSQRAVIHLGAREPTDWITRAVGLLRPRSPDLDAIDAALEQAIASRFDLYALPPGDHEALAPRIDALYAFGEPSSLDADTVAVVNEVLGTDAVFATQLVAHSFLRRDEDACSGRSGFAIEVRLLQGRDPGLASILMNVDCIEGGLGTFGAWNVPALVLYAVLLLVLARPVLRGWGTIQVDIRLPEKTKGFFSIHITTKPDQVHRERAKKSDREKTKAKRRFDFLSRFERHMAGRQTTFRWIPARAASYTVTVGGPLLEARGEEIIGHFLEEQKIRVHRRTVNKLEFDFRPKECAVEVRIEDDRRPVKSGRVAVRGDASSLRYARDGVAYLYLGLGSYMVVVGSEDSAAEVPLEIASLDNAIPLSVDLAESPGIVFRNCPGAVEPYLQGDLATAADALEAGGETQSAHRMRALLLEQQGRANEAANELEAAGELENAAELRATDSDFSASAGLFEQAGDFARAAETYRAADRFADAARCYELVYDYANALECWREVGEPERELSLLEKLGEYMDAAQIARELGDSDRAISSLQQIDQRHIGYGEACRLIAEILDERGDHDLAVSKFEEAIGSLGAENASAETLEGYAGALERAGRLQEAISAYEAVRRRDAFRENVAERIALLKERLEQTPPETVPAAAGPLEARTRVVESRYELLEEIGRGGMGVVFKARDKRLGRIVALKQLPENLRDHPSAVDLFEREARAAAALNHVNIVTLFDAGEEGGSYFITMELLEGRTLNAILDRRGRLSARDVARLGMQISAGLQYAHERRIVHRDIKTANLFFTNDQIVKIMDFGIAKSMEEVRRSTTVVGGTPYYMAPEQAKGEAVDHRADLYALGVTLFQLSTGGLPFRDGDVTYRHLHEAPPDPREIDLDLDARLATLILELMAKDPAERPASAADVAARLRAVAAGSRTRPGAA